MKALVRSYSKKQRKLQRIVANKKRKVELLKRPAFSIHRPKKKREEFSQSEKVPANVTGQSRKKQASIKS